MLLKPVLACVFDDDDDDDEYWTNVWWSLFENVFMVWIV